MRAGPDLLPQQRGVSTANHVHIHPPKIEYFDLGARTNTDPKGFVREVEEYRVEDFGLYLAREIVGHPTLAYLESWLLPELGIRVSDWYFRPGHERDQDFYIDIVQIAPGPEIWRATDLYLDVVLRTGRGLDVLDTDELIEAMAAGMVDQDTGRRAFETTFRAVEGLATHGHDLASWLAEMDLRLTWRRR
jgi:hypothetical protein